MHATAPQRALRMPDPRMTVADFRSDFVARPTEEMIEAMTREARRRPDFDLRLDQTVAALESRAAEILGKEDALFCPTCMQANQIAIHLACHAGDAVLAERSSHVFVSEAGALAALSGALAVPLAGRGGAIEIDALAGALRRGDASRPRSALLVLENTHVFSGGRVVCLDRMQALAGMARGFGAAIHLDGARLFNAATALSVTPAVVAACADSVAVSLNKGLAAPMGAILAGSRPWIAAALRVRQMFGGGWRPANILAAAALVALDTMIGRIAEDHAQARALAAGLAACRGIMVDHDQVQSNIVHARVDGAVLPATQLAQRLCDVGILVNPAGIGPGDTLRFVTHREISAAEVSRCVAAVAAVMGAA